jgi:starch phosphorylase
MKKDCKWEHPYSPAPEFEKRVAYFSMEFGIHQALKIYSGGLGYLAGSHMRSAYDLKQNMIGIGMLWKLGYYDQVWNREGKMRALFRERYYSFLEETDLIFPISVNGHEVRVQAYYLPAEVFGSVPLYLLTTDRERFNDYLGCSITHRLYDHNAAARIAQSMVLGIGGAKVVRALGGADLYHMNEAHALPLVFQLYEELGDVAKVREKVAFTTHTPVSAGNEVRNLYQLQKMGFFGNVPLDVACKITNTEDEHFGYTPAALALCRKANGVSQLHGAVANEMWSAIKEKPEIVGITNAQHRGFWQDELLKQAVDDDDDDAFRARKRRLKHNLFSIVADQTGKLFDPDLLTVVWGRRFAGYKRADLIMRDLTSFYDLLDAELPIQIIWAGKPYPEDDYAVDLFNRLIDLTHYCGRAAVVTGYEISLSAALKKGADVWLNTPRRPKEASGTSGMMAAMNGAVNFSTNDGWIPEFAEHGHNAFVIPEADTSKSEEEQDDHDYQHLMRILTDEVIFCYYGDPGKWLEIVKNSMREVVPEFDSNRMATEYYQRLYS